jgi:cytochrome c oxidase subunit 2
VTQLLRGWLNLPTQASTYAPAVDLLHFFVIGTTMAGATFVFLLALYFLVRYRQITPHALTARVQTPVLLEVFIIASLETLFLVFWVVGAAIYGRIMTPPPDAAPIYVTGKQWMWKFAYPDGRSSINVLTVPVDRPIKLVMTSRDVIHSFFVPSFRMKHDVVPGRYYTAWFTASQPGTFTIDCAEFCGTGHSRMIGEVRVLTAEDYERWLEDRPERSREGDPTSGGPTRGSLIDAGRLVAASHGCFNCHTVDGQPHIGPSFAGLFDSIVPLTDGRRIVADEAYLTKSMMDPQADVVAGYKPVMPTYRGALEEPEVAGLLEFMKSIRDRAYPAYVSLPKVNPEAAGQPQEPQGAWGQPDTPEPAPQETKR